LFSLSDSFPDKLLIDLKAGQVCTRNKLYTYLAFILTKSVQSKPPRSAVVELGTEYSLYVMKNIA